MHIPTDITQKIGLEPIFSNGRIRQETRSSTAVDARGLSVKNFTDELNSLMDQPPAPIVENSEKEHPVSNQNKSKISSFSFMDFIDIINPLQHIPIVSTIYRNITHDEIKAPARILGGGLFGGIIGAVAGLINSISDKITGKDIGDHAFALFKNHEVPQKQETEASIKLATAANPLYASIDQNRLGSSIRENALKTYKNLHELEIEKHQNKIRSRELDLYF